MTDTQPITQHIRQFLEWLADAINTSNTALVRPQEDYEIWGNYLYFRTTMVYTKFFETHPDCPFTSAQFGQYFRYQPYIRAMGQQRTIRLTRPKKNHIQKTIAVQKGQTTNGNWVTINLTDAHDDLPSAIHSTPQGYKVRCEAYIQQTIDLAKAHYPTYRVLYLQRLSDLPSV